MPGGSSPVVWERQIFLTGSDGTNCEVYAFDAADGKLMWTHRADAAPPGSNRPEVSEDTGLASPTPATDGRRVVVGECPGDRR